MYGSKLVQQVINKVMVDGKKSTAEKIVYEALDILAKRTSSEPVPALEESIKISPRCSRCAPAASAAPPTRCPSRCPQRRARTLAVRWLIEFARARREKSMAERLAGELVDAAVQQGGAYKRKDDIFRMAKANQAFAHYRWCTGACWRSLAAHCAVNVDTMPIYEFECRYVRRAVRGARPRW
jgi:small subunit ribosomal protein S7